MVADWRPDASVFEWARRSRPDGIGSDEAVVLAALPEFVDFWLAAKDPGGRPVERCDWTATLRNRLRELDKRDRLPVPVRPHIEPRNDRGETQAEESARWRREAGPMRPEDRAKLEALPGGAAHLAYLDTLGANG